MGPQKSSSLLVILFFPLLILPSSTCPIRQAIEIAMSKSKWKIQGLIDAVHCSKLPSFFVTSLCACPQYPKWQTMAPSVFTGFYELPSVWDFDIVNLRIRKTT